MIEVPPHERLCGWRLRAASCHNPGDPKMVEELLQACARRTAPLPTPTGWTCQERPHACLVEIGDRDPCSPHPSDEGLDGPLLITPGRLSVADPIEGSEELHQVSVEAICGDNFRT
jgi:hypothetical protein